MSTKKNEGAASSTPAGKPVEVWGIMTCNSTRKALKFYEAANVPHTFKDLKKVSPPKSLLRDTLKAIDSPKKLFNTSGKSYQDGAYKDRIAGMSKDDIVEAMVQDPMLIKRPLVKGAGGITVGYDEAKLAAVVK